MSAPVYAERSFKIDAVVRSSRPREPRLRGHGDEGAGFSIRSIDRNGRGVLRPCDRSTPISPEGVTRAGLKL